MKQRDNNLDALRVLANVLVIILHVSATYVTLNIEFVNSNFVFASLINSFTRIGVPVFVMISGYLTLSNPKNREYKYFYKKFIKSIVYPTLIWSFLYVILSTVIVSYKALSDPFISLSDYLSILINWLLGKPYTHLWYMYMMIGMFAFAPVLMRIKEKLSDKQFESLGFILLGLGIMINALFNVIWFLLFIEYMGYFIIGYCFKKRIVSDQRDVWKFTLISLLSGFIVFLLTDLNVREGLLTNKLYFYENLSPFVIYGSLSTFILFIKLKKISFDFTFLAAHSSTIYFVHAGIFTLVTFLKDYLLKMDFSPLWYIPLASFFVYLSSLVFSILLAHVSKKIRKRGST
jgi:surface polysaccharide O-acyltransferase-like enzyme